MWTGKIKQIRFSQSALTLSELVVSSVIITVIMVGAVSVDFASRRIQKTAFQESQVSMRSSAAMIELMRAASNAIGDPFDPGIYYDETGYRCAICFRYDADSQPGDYSGDLWNCFLAGSNNDLWSCPDQPAYDTHCPDTGDKIILELDPDLKSEFFQVIKDGDDKVESIEFTLISRHDQTQESDMFDNPAIETRSSVSPSSALDAVEYVD